MNDLDRTVTHIVSDHGRRISALEEWRGRVERQLDDLLDIAERIRRVLIFIGAVLMMIAAGLFGELGKWVVKTFL